MLNLDVKIEERIKKLGMLFREARRNKRIHQKELADILSLNEATISSWESNRIKPPIDKIIKLSNILEINREVAKLLFDYNISEDENANKNTYEKDLASLKKNLVVLSDRVKVLEEEKKSSSKNKT